MNNYREEAILFGPEEKLLGVLTLPTGQPMGSVACLMSNFGVLHRVGPRRIQVKLARRLAQQGVASLRFDLSGLGDSRASSQSGGDFDQLAVDDMRTAISELQRRLAIRQVAIIGLCSGAAHGLEVALQDPRVTGLLTFDGHTYASGAAKLRRRMRRFTRFPLAQLHRWGQVLLGLDKKPSGDLLQNGESSKVLSADGFRQALESLVGRGVAVYLVHSGTFQKSDRNRNQLHGLRGAPVIEKVRYEFMGNVDHSFTEVSAQESFISAACGWVAGIRAGTVEPQPAEVPAVPAAALAPAAERSLAAVAA